MPTKDFDLEDPLDLVGTPVPIEEGHDNQEEMARCVIDEYLGMGWSGKVVLNMFKTSRFLGPHTIYRARGEEYVVGLIEDGKERHRALMQRLFGKSV